LYSCPTAALYLNFWKLVPYSLIALAPKIVICAISIRAAEE
jgi:hypothetical protein